MSSGNVYITGAGIISALGNDLSSTFDSLVQQRSGIVPLQNFDAALPEQPPVGEVPYTNRELAVLLDLDTRVPHSRTFLLGLYAARQAVQHAQISPEDLRNTAFISATTVGGMDQTEDFLPGYFLDPAYGRIRVIGQHDCGASTENIVRQLHTGGFFTTINTACSSAANAIMLGARMIRAGQTDLVIAGGVDPLCRFTLNGFHSLMLLSGERCKPFDANRNGLNLGEGAAYLVLCSEKLAQTYTPIAELAGWGNANDAFHATASSPEGRGAVLAMQTALQQAGLQPYHMQYINAHGTATTNNDLAESTALTTVFGNVPAFSSTKSCTGHTLAAAGAIEAVISLLALREQTVFPNPGFTEAMHETGLVPETAATKKTIHSVLSNSFGFGGNCASLIFNTCTG